MNDYTERMARVVDWIEKHITKETDLDAVASITCFSSFHVR